MKHALVQLPTIKLVGVAVCTSNAAEFNAATAKIGATMQKFFGTGLQNKITHRAHQGVIFAAYTNYESDLNGEYTYFIGQEVTSFQDLSSELTTLTIPAQKYAQYTSDAGQMPHVVIDMWQQIWQMSPATLGGQRAYITDFERYDERSADSASAIVEIYIGIK